MLLLTQSLRRSGMSIVGYPQRYEMHSFAPTSPMISSLASVSAAMIDLMGPRHVWKPVPRQGINDGVMRPDCRAPDSTGCRFEASHCVLWLTNGIRCVRSPLFRERRTPALQVGGLLAPSHLAVH
jgi:hypothetical protein